MRFRFDLFILIAMFAPLALQAQREKLPPADLAIVEKQWPAAKKTITGLRYIVLQEGEGPKAKPGDLVSVLYRGATLDGKVFDEKRDREQPLIFRLGRGQVIQGWDQGLQLMSRGSKLLLIIPHELGYGTRGKPPKIGRQATLVFEVELLAIKHEPAVSNLPPPAEKKKPQKK